MRPLEDVRVIAIEQFGAGPFASVHLADLGAEVIKIEDPRTRGDVGRYIPPYQVGQDSLFFQTFNRNKRSISLDLTVGSGRSVFEDLVRVSDVVHSNLRGDVPEKLDLRYEDLKGFNPAIVCASLSGYGMTGPRAAHPGYDYMLQGLAGWMSLTGEPDGAPAKSGLSLVDFSGGFVAVGAILAGLHAARRDGIGMDCDLGLYDTALNMLTYPATWHLTEGFEPTRTRHSAHPSLVPFQNFESQDGWIVVGCAKEKFWKRLVEVLGVDELDDADRFGSFAVRRTNADDLLPLLEDAFAEKTTAEWIDLLTEAGIPCAPISTVGEALRDDHTKARGMIVETDHPIWGTVKQVASAIKVGDMSTVPHRRAPELNEDADYVLRDLLRYDASQVDHLAAEGAFGPVEV
ncbi:MAG: CoA transferase [Acidimicrobiia bacterium]|nr:CoA transferase [Acidimicrobiia bacterium]MDH3462100.1 CoA transferase [Acidimicrobiia bacterium]